MMACAANLGRPVQIAAVTAILEGTMAAAVEVLGAEAALNTIRPLVDKALSHALGGRA
jgi:hypothetical protein